MTKRFLSLVAVLAISLLTACAQTPQINTYPNYNRAVTNNCCGSCPCGAAKSVFEDNSVNAYGYESSEGKMCDPAMKKKHHHKRHHHVKAEGGKPTIPSGAPVKAEAAPKAKGEPEAKNTDVFAGVKKIIKDVSPKDTKKPQ